MSQLALSYIKTVQDRVKAAKTVVEAQQVISEVIASLERRPEEYVTGGGRTRGRSYFDNLIQRMMDQVKAAESREALISDTLRALADDKLERDERCYLVLEGFVRSDGNIVDMSVTAYEGIQDQRLENFKKNILPELFNSSFIRDVLVDRDTYEFLPTNFVNGISYFGEFDDLVGKKRSGMWICALPLPPADAQRPSRMLIAFYPMVGSSDAPALPRGAMQEWRTLTFMRAAYEMLNHQLASTGEVVAQQRREILADLGPGLVNHEINQQLKVIDESTNLMNWAIRRIDSHIPPGDQFFDSLINGLINVMNAVRRLHNIADAFNNLERRPTDTPISITALIDEVTTLLNYKIARVGAKLTCEGDHIDIVTDASLLEHVLINILANALEAMDADHDNALMTPKLHIFHRRIESNIEILIFNNGPEISLARPERLFEKGFTTKARGLGHGLGLYLCRIIMVYLGGNIALLQEHERPSEFSVGFRLLLPITRRGSDAVSPAEFGA